MATRAKFRCDSVTDFGGGGKEAKLSAVCPPHFDKDGKHEDSQFALFTPSGSLTIFVTNPDLQDFFKPTRTYYLDVTECE